MYEERKREPLDPKGMQILGKGSSSHSDGGRKFLLDGTVSIIS